MSGQRGPVTVAGIQEAVACVFGVAPAEMRSACRARAVARPRQVAMFVARQLTTRSMAEIGRAFGGRDHTTVMHAIQVMPRRLESDPELAARVDMARALAAGLSTAAADRGHAARLAGILAERETEIDRLTGIVARLSRRVVEQADQIARLRAGGPSAPRRPCLKCGRAIVSPYPGLCGHCREENRRVSPLAEGIVG